MRIPKAIICTVAAAALPASTEAWTSKMPSGTNPQITRKSALETLLQGGAATVAASLMVQQGALSPAFAAETLPSGVTYEVLKKGDGPKPEIGELVAIRFAAYFGDRKIDDIFETPEPYYTRLGSGGLLKGVESTLPEMRVGDRWKLVIPGSLAFGPKGRPASAGKPRIPPDAEITFDVEMVGLPGKEPELIELIGDV
ncbi:FKBP-type peptidylprolyl isomerase [Nitzschia inconspicua]|uniref:peptidylprolyl isomerase n=1 Tax=Nitzschia inconspicua TaxID=303405 RepID=A0A9K3PP92_9STRA|nr:FKBP-type peptidylprolyl isomerase [Nitzschia inconspicua]